MRPAIRRIILGGGITSSDSDVRAYIAAIIAAGGTITQARADLLTTYVTSGKANGWWAKLDRLNVRAGENSTQALIDLVARSASVLTVAPPFTPNLGFTGDGSSKFITWAYNPATNGVQYVRDSACFGAWVQTNDSRTAGNPAYMGTSSAGNTFVRASSTQTGWAVNVASGANTTVSPTTGIGFAHFERTVSNFSTFYQNGISQGTQAGVSVAVVSQNMFELATNNGSGTAVQFNNGVVSLSFAGGGMGAPPALAFYNDTHTLMHAIDPVAFP